MSTATRETSMNHQPVKSSHIKSIGWDNNVLEVRFKNGSIYQYHGVPRADHVALMAAKSHGAHLKSDILGKYKTVRVK
jgi:hypothetical protein